MNNPRILIIDDQADEENAQLIVSNQLPHVTMRHPQDVTTSDLESANVVVVDFRLESWPERDANDCIALKPMNGLALLQILKSHELQTIRTPTAFILRSAHLTDLTAERQPDTRLHSIASQHGLEWVLEKTIQTHRSTEQYKQICSLADAVAALPERWPTDNRDSAIELFLGWLHLPNAPWRSVARQDLEDCHPPIHELEYHRDGMRLVRWMTQRILPYPCFLINESRLAVRLKVTFESLEDGLAHGLQNLLEPSQYFGALYSFGSGRFWWRSGIEFVLWELSNGRSFDTNLVVGLLNQACGNRLRRLAVDQPVLCLDDKFGWLPEPIDVTEAVRIQPDDWPLYAEQAWARHVDAMLYHQLAATVIAADRDKLSANEEDE